MVEVYVLVMMHSLLIRNVRMHTEEIGRLWISNAFDDNFQSNFIFVYTSNLEKMYWILRNAYSIIRVKFRINRHHKS